MRRLGALNAPAPNDPIAGARAASLARALEALHWHEGGNLRIDRRWTGGETALYDRYAAELVGLNPDVILAGGTPAVAALRRQTTTIPIVFVVVTDPVGQQFVASLARPGGNVTGFTDFDPPMVGKWLEMLAQVTPRPTRVAVLFNPETSPQTAQMLHVVENAAPTVAMAVRPAPCRDDASITAALADLAREENGGLLVLPDSFTVAHREAIVAVAARYRLPAVYWNRSFTDSSGLMSYGTDNGDQFRRSADYIDRILRGNTPSDLPVQTPTKIEMVVNLKTARALGLSVSPTMLALAEEVIE